MEENTGFNISERVDDRLNKGFRINFENFFERAWELFKKTWWQILIGTLITRAASEIVSRILTPLFMPELDIDPNDFVNGSSVNWEKIIDWITKLQSSPMLHLAALITAVLIVFVTAPIHAGFLKICREADKGDTPAEVGSLFSYFKGSYTGRLIFSQLIIVILSSLLGFGFSYIPLFGPVIGSVLTLVFYFLFIFVTPLIIFGNASLGEAFRLSIRLSLSKFFPIVGFIFLAFLLASAGIFACCIGIIATQAFLWGGVYNIYKDAVGFHDDDVNNNEPANDLNWQNQPPAL